MSRFSATGQPLSGVALDFFFWSRERMGSSYQENLNNESSHELLISGMQYG
jgi:hypothetical protein